MVYQLCADFVYIALPERGARLADLSLLEANGVGLICVHSGPRCKILLPAKLSSVIDAEYREFYVGLLSERFACR